MKGRSKPKPPKKLLKLVSKNTTYKFENHNGDKYSTMDISFGGTKIEVNGTDDDDVTSLLQNMENAYKCTSVVKQDNTDDSTGMYDGYDNSYFYSFKVQPQHDNTFARDMLYMFWFICHENEYTYTEKYNYELYELCNRMKDGPFVDLWLTLLFEDETLSSCIKHKKQDANTLFCVIDPTNILDKHAVHCIVKYSCDNKLSDSYVEKMSSAGSCYMYISLVRRPNPLSTQGTCLPPSAKKPGVSFALVTQYKYGIFKDRKGKLDKTKVRSVGHFLPFPSKHVKPNAKDVVFYVEAICSNNNGGAQLLRYIESCNDMVGLVKPDFVALTSLPTAYSFYLNKANYKRTIDFQTFYPVFVEASPKPLTSFDRVAFDTSIESEKKRVNDMFARLSVFQGEPGDGLLLMKDCRHNAPNYTERTSQLKFFK